MKNLPFLQLLPAHIRENLILIQLLRSLKWCIWHYIFYLPRFAWTWSQMSACDPIYSMFCSQSSNQQHNWRRLHCQYWFLLPLAYMKTSPGETASPPTTGYHHRIQESWKETFSYHYHCLAWFPPLSDLLIHTKTKPHRWSQWRGMWQSRIFSSFHLWSSVVSPTAIINESYKTEFLTRKFCPLFISPTQNMNRGKTWTFCNFKWQYNIQISLHVWEDRKSQPMELYIT